MARGEVDFVNAVDALLALASESERAAYEREIAEPPRIDGYGQEVRDTSVQDILLPRLIDKLRSGEWIASGFGFQTGQPTKIHRRQWQRLTINVSLNSAYDSWANVSHNSATGSFHSLGFEAAGKGGSTGHSDRAKMIAKIKAQFERLDKELPLRDPKSRSFQRAFETHGEDVPETWLKAAWKSAKINPKRRRAGLKSN